MNNLSRAVSNHLKTRIKYSQISTDHRNNKSSSFTNAALTTNNKNVNNNYQLNNKDNNIIKKNGCENIQNDDKKNNNRNGKRKNIDSCQTSYNNEFNTNKRREPEKNKEYINDNNEENTYDNMNENYYSILDELGKSEKEIFKSVKDSMDENLNLEFLRSTSENYIYKVTSRGPVCYSSTYRDDKYIYRHIILSDNVRQYAEKKVRRTNAFLTEHCIINELQIDIGKGWKHFMIYDGKIRELILRKVLTAEDKLRMAVQMQRYN
ncbi:cyclin-dependent kinases regulatory subunit, putative [Plasmodium berghei]|uniref:Cyclin-dependent kinases regulatory subunit n=2 Tax=Plasmodium berghei TaxID=5821 RepID=A0A509AIN7_PLABA|nr:cyclin-dependent kinases regulatory subunit, putative [Plasmodium berghei ANKA]CXI34505.1 cyclin-dependent kinases regulatory subunit, putative [Plasmodium berghei]SCM21386.1 cyclin-dependent kinases regulatory subunit, putative [Plasmodium berghei]SCN24629.1 cyclin-dependent kinases regulatory subunit, putative [Plasmodium berghei]SCO59791.1 cyclin-dependent kinases regulatory subunit, putative [Plasmodium berghei]SCO61054.1 cyclin-dependent kinases regulatory subunit, putative [Plasmodium|eukprot:XP_034421216.1 cyclin-dependent kinases regulatory subunit, putative [Plasmodium berghei ANKA]